ncbi:hypothetical protein BXZ70DRAFT_441460 [Cristinia sonorae]|uniref:F-box domain-containing protein n=1 Tax=Cristinia sonorae TaxID=1940300 RepID=A0A8K0XMV0_9AGAR|nr:hypothetical protein BXZ70DRAFT_441460 [Cristinia sonorae]
MLMLNYDVLLQIVQCIYHKGSYDSLFRCATVNRDFHRAATSALYQRVTLSPKADNGAQLDLRRRNQNLNGLFESARLSHHAIFVTELVISGWLLETSAPRNNFSYVLRDAVQLWSNLSLVTLAPKQAPKELTDVVLPAMSSYSLRSLTISSACFSEEALRLLLHFKRLEELTIISPGRGMLQVLPEWLPYLSATLTMFRLMDSCGSVTPGVLRSFIPHLPRVHTFGIGLSYSLTHDDIFAFLNELPQIRSLDVRYYLQIRPTTVRVHLSNLRSLIVRYNCPEDRSDVDHLVKWIRQCSSSSPLNSIRLINDNRLDVFPSLSYDGLLDHLGLKHGLTLRSFELEGGTVGKKALRSFCSRCHNLEKLSTSVRSDIIWDIPELSNIRSVLLTTPHAKHRWRRDYEDERIKSDIFRPPSLLRSFGIDKHRWKGSWKITVEGHEDFVVQRASMPKPPKWEEEAREAWKWGSGLYDI